MARRAKYAAGDWFAIPLRDHGFACGVIARANPQGVLLGYFFGPRWDDRPTLAATLTLKPDAAILIGRFGHLGLRGGDWPIIGRQEDWNREVWPMPILVRHEELSGRTFHVFYDPDDPLQLIREEQVTPGLAEPGPEDSLMGAGFVELRLTQLLGDGR